MSDADIAADISTGATVTNVAVRDLIAECFAYLDSATGGDLNG